MKYLLTWSLMMLEITKSMRLKNLGGRMRCQPHWFNKWLLLALGVTIGARLNPRITYINETNLWRGMGPVGKTTLKWRFPSFQLE